MVELFIDDFGVFIRINQFVILLCQVTGDMCKKYESENDTTCENLGTILYSWACKRESNLSI